MLKLPRQLFLWLVSEACQMSTSVWVAFELVMCHTPKINQYFGNFMHILVGPILVSKFKQFNKYHRIDKYRYTDKYCESRSAESLNAHVHILLLYT